jgi:DNA-binding CsgD family transcriptional regulator
MLPLDKPIISPLLIGRAYELERLERALTDVQAGAGRCFLLAGEAGVGKSRLVAEVCANAANQGFLTLQGQCFEQDISFPYAPWIDLMRLFCARRTPAEVQTALGPLAGELVKLLPELVLSLPGLQPSPALDPEAEKRRLFATLAQLLIQLTQPPAEAAQATPLLVIVEDIHWSDETSLDFLHFFTRRLAAYPILLLATYRREETSPALTYLLAQFDRERLARELELERLPLAEVRAMFQAIFDMALLVQAEFWETLYAFTEGNPFFIEELLKSLVAAGDIFYAAGRWQSKSLDQLHIPRSVYVAVQRRVKALSQPARTVLTLAAVAGRRFDFTLLQQVAQFNETELLRLLKELLAAQLVVEESAEQFAFRHALTREAIYSDLLVRERQALHRTIAETIVQLYGDSARLDSYLPDLAYHFYEAGIWDKAVEYAQRAGDRAQTLDTPRAAVEQFTRALDAAHQGAIEPLPTWYRSRGQAYETLGDFERARADYETALRIARTRQDRQAEWQALLDLGFLWESRDYPQAGEYYQQGLRLVRDLDAPHLLARNLNRIGNWYLNLGQPHESSQYYHEALAIFRTLADQRQMAETLNMLGTASYSGGDLVQGTLYHEQAVALFRQVNDRYGLFNSLVHLTLHGDFETEVWGVTGLAEIVRGGEEAVQIARKSGWRSDEAHALVRLAVCLARQGQFQRAFTTAQAGLVIAQEIEHREWLCDAHYALGSLLLDLFALAEAQQRLEQSLALSREIGSRLMVYVVSSRLAITYSRQNEFIRAEAVLNEALAPDALPLTALERGVWRARAELALARGEPEQALQIANQLIASATNVEKYEEGCIPCLWTLRGQALGALGRWAEAETALRAAQKFAQESRPLLWRIHLALGQTCQAQKRQSEAELEFVTVRQIIETLAANLAEPGLRDNFRQQATAMIPPPPPLSPRQAAKKEFDGLTEREREVAVLIAEGKSNRDIAAALVVSERTVTTHVGNILAKLDFTSRVQIAAWAIEKGLARSPSN